MRFLRSLGLCALVVVQASCAIYQLVQSEDESPKEDNPASITYPVYDAGVEAIPVAIDVGQSGGTGGIDVGNPANPNLGTGGIDVGNPGQVDAGTGGIDVGNPNKPSQGTGGIDVGNPNNPNLQQFERSLFGGIDVGNPLWKPLLTFAPDDKAFAQHVSTNDPEQTLEPLNDKQNNLFVLLTVNGSYPKDVAALIVNPSQIELLGDPTAGLTIEAPQVTATSLMAGRTTLLATGQTSARSYAGISLSLASGTLRVAGKPMRFARGTKTTLSGALPIGDTANNPHILLLSLSLTDSFTIHSGKVLFQPALTLRSALRQEEKNIVLLYSALPVSASENTSEDVAPAPTVEDNSSDLGQNPDVSDDTLSGSKDDRPAASGRPTYDDALPGWDYDKALAYCNGAARPQDIPECLQCTRLCDIKAIWDRDGVCMLANGTPVDSGWQCEPLQPE